MVHGIGCSLNLNIVLLFLGSIGNGLLSMGKQSIRKTCRCRATRCCKKPELLGWDPPPPLNKHNRFQRMVPSHIKSCTAPSGRGRGVRGKKTRLFVTKGIWQRKPRFNKQGLYAWLWSGHLFIVFTMPISNHLRKPGRDMSYQYQIIWWTQNLNLHPGTLQGPHLSVKPFPGWSFAHWTFQNLRWCMGLVVV